MISTSLRNAPWKRRIKGEGRINLSGFREGENQFGERGGTWGGSESLTRGVDVDA